MELEHLTIQQLAEVCHGIGRITANGRSIFGVRVINAHNDQLIGVDKIRQSGMVYLKISLRGHIGNFPVWVDVPEAIEGDRESGTGPEHLTITMLENGSLNLINERTKSGVMFRSWEYDGMVVDVKECNHVNYDPAKVTVEGSIDKANWVDQSYKMHRDLVDKVEENLIGIPYIRLKKRIG